VEDFQIDFSLENFEETEDKFIFTAKSITKDFVCEKGLKRLASDSPGKHLVWRHEHPIIPKYKSTHIFGRVLESNVEDGYIVSRYEAYKHTTDHKKAIEDIKLRKKIEKPLSISMRYRQYGKENPTHFDVLEHSLTPTPACKECVVIDIQNERDKMDKEQIEKRIKELEDELTKKDKTLEELESKIVTLEKESETKDEDIKAKDKELEDSKSENDKIVEQLLEFKDKLNEQKDMIDKLNSDLKFKEVEPLINQLVELDGNEMRDLYLMKVKQDFEKGKEFLMERIDELEKRGDVHAVTEDLAETANKAIGDESLEEDEKTRKKRDKSAFANMPIEFFKKRDGE